MNPLHKGWRPAFLRRFDTLSQSTRAAAMADHPSSRPAQRLRCFKCWGNGIIGRLNQADELVELECPRCQGSGYDPELTVGADRLERKAFGL